MIVSTDEKESEVWPSVGVKVKLDGIEQPLCVYADDELRIIKRHVLDKKGKQIFKDGKAVTETVFGHVEIIIGD